MVRNSTKFYNPYKYYFRVERKSNIYCNTSTYRSIHEISSRKVMQEVPFAKDLQQD